MVAGYKFFYTDLSVPFQYSRRDRKVYVKETSSRMSTQRCRPNRSRQSSLTATGSHLASNRQHSMSSASSARIPCSSRYQGSELSAGWSRTPCPALCLGSEPSEGCRATWPSTYGLTRRWRLRQAVGLRRARRKREA